MEELTKENVTDEFTFLELIRAAIADESWEVDPLARETAAMGFYGYVTRFL